MTQTLYAHVNKKIGRWKRGNEDECGGFILYLYMKIEK
jgi:hypothetical protein